MTQYCIVPVMLRSVVKSAEQRHCSRLNSSITSSLTFLPGRNAFVVEGLLMSRAVVCRCMMGCRQVWKVYMQLVICLMWSGGKPSQRRALAAWQLCQQSATSPPTTWRGNITPRSRSALLQFHIPHLVAIRWEALCCAMPWCVHFAMQSVPRYAAVCCAILCSCCAALCRAVLALCLRRVVSLCCKCGKGVGARALLRPTKA